MQGPANKTVMGPVADAVSSLPVSTCPYSSSVHWPTANRQGLCVFAGGLPLKLQEGRSVLSVGPGGWKGQAMNIPRQQPLTND